MTYTDQQCSQFYAAITETKYNVQDYQIVYARKWLDRLTEAGITVDFPIKVDYRVHVIAADNQPSTIPPRNWAVYKYVNDVRADWIGDFNKRNHAEDMRDLLTNDLEA